MNHIDTDLPIYEQQPNESNRHYSWFHTYMLLGPKREMLQAFNSYRVFNSASKSLYRPSNSAISPAKFVSGAWKEAAKKWEWDKRVKAWDKEQLFEERQRRLAWQIETEEKMARTLDDILDQMERVHKVISQMLSFPLTTKTVSDDGMTITITPTKWTLDTAFRALNAMGLSLKATVEVKRILDEMYHTRTLIEALDTGDLDVNEARKTLVAAGYVLIEPGDVVTLTSEQLRDNEMIRLQATGDLLAARIEKGDKSAIKEMMALSRQISVLQGLNLPAAKERPRPKGARRDLSKFSTVEKEIMADILNPDKPENGIKTSGDELSE